MALARNNREFVLNAILIFKFVPNDTNFGKAPKSDF